VAGFDRYRDATAYSTRSVIDGDRPILLVIHSEDATWQFLPGDEVDVDEGVALHLAHITDAHPELAVLADLEPGCAAERASAGSAWRRFPWPGEE
jgi:hypothetical protein